MLSIWSHFIHFISNFRKKNTPLKPVCRPYGKISRFRPFLFTSRKNKANYRSLDVLNGFFLQINDFCELNKYTKHFVLERNVLTTQAILIFFYLRTDKRIDMRTATTVIFFSRNKNDCYINLRKNSIKIIYIYYLPTPILFSPVLYPKKYFKP